MKPKRYSTQRQKQATANEGAPNQPEESVIQDQQYFDPNLQGSKCNFYPHMYQCILVTFALVLHSFLRVSISNDQLSAAAIIKVLGYLGAALTRLRRLTDNGAYFNDC